MGLYFTARIMISWDTPNSNSKVRINVTIPRGASLQEISEILQKNNLIRDKFVFQLYVKIKKLENKLQAGDYEIQKNLTNAEIVELLQNGKSEQLKITIPEGSTIEQIDDILAKKSLIKPGEFVTCTKRCQLSFSVDTLEGYLFPSTYFVNANNFSSKDFIERLYKEFQKQIEPLRDALNNSTRSLNDIVIVASMIEREAFSDDEMSMISDVIWKRLDEGIPLGIDATTRYEKNDWTNPLYTEDFESDSLYNTRKKLGLPPTAISNPSIKAI